MTANRPAPLRAYLVSHKAQATLEMVVAARTAKEAIEAFEADRNILDDWAGESFPVTHLRARRAPEYDAQAARLEPTDV